jgi:hypothetical protein
LRAGHEIASLPENEEFPKGRNEEWGSLLDPFFHPAKISQLFGQDYV